MKNDWFKKTTIKRTGESRSKSNANIFGFICGKNRSVSQTGETGEIGEVRQHKKERTARENFKIRAREGSENAEV